MANVAMTSHPLALQSILLRSSEIDIAKDFHPNLPGQGELLPLFRNVDGHFSRNTTTFGTGDGSQQEAKWVQFVSRFEFVYVRPKADGAPPEEHEFEQHRVASIRADIAASYIINSEDFPSDEVLQHWATNNVMLHTWPYWREYCHNTLLRTGLPVTLIPLISLAQQRGQNPSPE